MCGITTKGQISSQDLYERTQLDDMAAVHLIHQLSWHGHVELSDGCLKKVKKLKSTGGCGHGQPNKTWTEVIDMGRLGLGLTETNPSDRKAMSGRLRNAVRADPPLYQGLIKPSVN